MKVKSKVILSLLGILLLSIPAFALDSNGDPISFQDLLDNIDTLNVNLETRERTIPALLGFLLGTQVVEVTVTKKSGFDTIITAVIRGGKVISIKEGRESPTLLIDTTEIELDNILAAGNPTNAVNNAINQKKLNINPVGFLNKIRFGVFSLFGYRVSRGAATQVVQPLQCGVNTCLNANPTDQCVRFSCGANLRTDQQCPGTPFQKEMCPILTCNNVKCIGQPSSGECITFSCGQGIISKPQCPGTQFTGALCPKVQCGDNICLSANPNEKCVRYSCGAGIRSDPQCPGTPFNRGMCPQFG